MKWVTRDDARVNCIATAWLIRRFIDPQAEFTFVPPEDVARIQLQKGAKGFDPPGATYPHKDANGQCSFEALVDEHFAGDAALQALARIVHCAARAADTTDRRRPARDLSRGFPLTADDDHDALAKASFLYDSLYASLKETA